jgi:hypothetical protein
MVRGGDDVTTFSIRVELDALDLVSIESGLGHLGLQVVVPLDLFDEGILRALGVDLVSYKNQKQPTNLVFFT